MTISDTTN